MNKRQSLIMRIFKPILVAGILFFLFGATIFRSTGFAAQAEMPPSRQTISQITTTVQTIPAHVIEAAPQGFGDQSNTTAWSMQWWRGHLYVGTQRNYTCWRSAMWAAALPNVNGLYPPNQPDANCTASPVDLSMQGEIWRWTPRINLWERVYQSPKNVPIPGYPGKFVARDIGFRGMLVYTDTNGTEALYVTGVSARQMFTDSEKILPPRLLHTTNGVQFDPVPQTAGTFLGNLASTGLRSGTVFEEKMFLNHGNARGEGMLIVSDTPALGNNHFRAALPTGITIWDVKPFNGSLYIGVASLDGFGVIKTQAQGTPPYTFTTVITAGGYLRNPSPSLVSMEVFSNSLYVGTYQPAELYRINADDSWDLIIGQGRLTPNGFKSPLSGYNAGFNWPYNVQIYRMHTYSNTLYLGTLDVSRDVTEFANESPGLDNLLSWHYGFDLYTTTDGTTFETLTTTGFGDPFQVQVRTFETTPYGLFMGTGSYWYGLRIWRWLPQDQSEYGLYIPFLQNRDAVDKSLP